MDCVIGERRIGKTTILEHLEKQAEKPMFAFFCNLEGVKEDFFFSRIMQHLVNKIQAEFKEPTPSPSQEGNSSPSSGRIGSIPLLGGARGGLSLALFEKDHSEYDDLDFEDDIETVLNFLREHYNPQVAIIMCLDEIDATQGFSNDTHSRLRNIFQTHQGTIRLVAAGVSVKRGEWSLPTSPWYNFFEFKPVEPLETTAAARLITGPVKGFYKYDNAAVEAILQKTNSKPFYIQQLCKKAIARILDEHRRKVTLEDVQAIYSDLIHLELNREFETFWEELSPGLQQVIIRAAARPQTTIPKDLAAELMNNAYNHGHKVMTIQEEKIRFSTIFRDWLDINYVK